MSSALGLRSVVTLRRSGNGDISSGLMLGEGPFHEAGICI